MPLPDFHCLKRNKIFVYGELLSEQLPIAIEVTVGSSVEVAIERGETMMHLTLDYGDGSGLLDITTMLHNTFSHIYTLEGEYYVTAHEHLMDVKDSLKVLVRGPQKAIDVKCPELVVTGEPFTCTFTLLRGSGYTLSLHSQETAMTHNYTLPDLSTKVYGNSWASDGSPQSSLVLDTCNTVYVYDSTLIREDEYISAVDGWMGAVSTVYANTMQESCEVGGEPECPAEGEWICPAPMYLCGSTCLSVSPTSCPEEKNTTLLGDSTYSALNVATFEMQSGYSNMAVPLAPLKPYSYFSVGCPSGLATANQPAQIMYRDTSSSKTQGDVVFLTSASPIFSMTERDTRNLLLRFKTLSGRVTDLGPFWNCTKPSVRAIGEFTGLNSLELINASSWVMDFELSSGVVPGDLAAMSSHSIKCQTVITAMEAFNMYFGSLSSTVIPVFLLTGGPVSIHITIGDGDNTKIWNYVDVVPDGGGSYSTQYMPPRTGRFNATVRVENLLNQTEFVVGVNVIPEIIEAEWEVVSLKPWATPPGEVTFTLICRGSDDPPWTANFSLADGSAGPALIDIDPNDLALAGFTFTHNITFSLPHLSAGIQNLTLNFFNEVSWVKYPISVDIREAIVNITTAIGILLEEGGDPLAAGEINGIPILPSMVPAVFTPVAGRGIPSYWGLFDEYDTLMNITQTKDDMLHFIFTEEGLRNLTIKAYSEAEGWVPAEKTLNIEVLNKIQGLSVTDYNIITPANQSKVFSISLEVFHPITCLLIDYNDGSPEEVYGTPSLCQNKYPSAAFKGGPLSNPFNLTHLYMYESLYNVTVVVEDLLIALRERLPVVVAYLPCKAPVVWISNGVSTPLDAPATVRSRQFKVQGEAQVECNGTVETRKSWTITKVEDEAGIPVEEIMVEGILQTWNFSELSVPARFLDYGTYLFTYRLQLMASKIFPLFRTDSTFYKVTKTPLQAVIMKGAMSKVSRGYKTSFMLDPLQYSQDPDWPDIKNFTYVWYCRSVQDPDHPTESDGRPKVYNKHPIPEPLVAAGSTGGGCFGKGPGTLDYTLGSLNLDTSSFTHADNIYELQVMIMKDTRFAVARVLVEVMSITPPTIDIKCADPKLCLPTFSGILINPTSRVALQSLCTYNCYSDMMYSWNITTVSGEPVVEEMFCPESTPTTTSSPDGESSDSSSPCPPVVPTGKSSKDIAVSSDLFLLNPGVEKYKLTLTVNIPSGGRGEYVMTLVVNKPPKGGECAVIPPVGLALVDTFSIECSNWEDPEEAGVSQYVFFMRLPMDDVFLKETIVSTSSAIAELILPVGEFTIFTDIWDKFGTYVEHTVGTVTVVMPTKEQVEAYNASAKIKHLTAVGDQLKIGMVLKAQASIRENAPWLSLDTEALGNLTSEEMDDRLKEVATMNTEALYAAVNTMTVDDLPGLDAMASVLRNAVAGIDKAEAAAKTVDMEAREAAVDLVLKMTDKVDSIQASPDELIPFLSSTVGAMESIMNGLRKIVDGENITNIPPTDRDNAKDWDYDADIGDDTNFVLPEDRQTMLGVNVLEKTGDDAKKKVGQIMDVVNRLSAIVGKRLVEGESILAPAPNGATMMMAKISEEVLLSGKQIDLSKQGSNVKLPEGFCPSKYSGKIGCNRTFSITAIEWPGITHCYVNSAAELSKKTHIISMDVFLEEARVNARKVEKGILFEITRPPQELPDAVFVSKTEASDNMSHQSLLYHSFTLSNENAALNIEISVNGSIASQLVLLMNHESLPTATRYELLRHVQQIPTNDLGVHDLFLSGDIIRNRTGRFFVAVGVLKEGTDAAALDANKTTLSSSMLSRDFDGIYSLRIFNSGCYFFNETSGMWSTVGLEVVSATYLKTVCRSTHLTSFGSRFFPTPNTINFDFIFANTGFLDNLSIYVALVISVCVFLLLLVVARVKDISDVKKRGVAPLPNNNVLDRYLYEIVVYTGGAKEASCESKVQIILSGECGESEIRTLEDKERRIFRRNGIDSFVMAEPRPLGDLQYLRIWHDNSGEGIMASWNLAFISVRDLQTQRKTLFIANRWLAIDYDNGEIDITLAASNVNELVNFTHLYEASKQRGFKDRHIWFSMFFRPPRSRYSRVERTMVCAAFVYLSMLCSAMWYSTVPDNPMEEGFFNLGPFSLTPEKAAVGLASLLAVYPLIQLIIWLFRRSGPRKRPYSRAYVARHEQQQSQREEMGLQREEPSPNVKTKDVISLSNTDERYEKPLKLGWCGRVLAWLLLLGVIGASIFFVWAFALQFGAEKTSRWLTSLLLTFLASILVTEPLMVVFGAVVEASCCKKKSAWQVDADDIDFDEIDPELEIDEEWQHITPLDPSYQRKVHIIPGNKDTSLLEDLRVKLVKEREMLLVLRDVGAYLIFVFMVMTLTYGERDESSFRMVTNFRNSFIKEGDIRWDLKRKVKTTDHYWLWLKEVMLMELRAQNWYNNAPPYGLRGYLNDRQNRIMGHAILRQIRNKKSCRPASQAKNLVRECSGWRGMELEDTRHYCAHWHSTEAFPRACEVPEFRYRTAEELQAFTSSGRLGSYSGGGYVLALQGSTKKVLARLNYLQQLQWIDKYTRAIMLEFSVYNTNVNLFGIATIMAEFHPGGGIRPYWRFDASPFIRSSGAYGMFIFLNELGFVMATIFFTLKEFWKCYNSGIAKYFSSYWNMAETAILGISYAAISLYILRYMEVQRVLEVFDRTYGNGYVRMEYAALLDLYLLYAIGFIVFFSTIKFIKLLQFNKRMNLLGLTLSHCWDDLRVFFFTFGIIFFTFTTLFFTIFNLQLEEFSSFLAALQMSFAMMLGKFDFEAMTLANNLSPVMFFVFSLSTTMILINLMLTIIIRTFTKIKNDLKNQRNKYDILDYISNKTMIMMNLRKEKPLPNVSIPVIEERVNQTTNEPTNREFPEKVDTLLAYINEMYFNGQMDFDDPYNKKSMIGGKSTNFYGNGD